MLKIIVATDFSIKSLNALNLAKIFAQKWDSQIHLVHVIEPAIAKYEVLGDKLRASMDDSYIMELITKVKQELRSLKAAHETEQIEIWTQIKVGDPYLEIEQEIRKIGADLLVVGAKGIMESKDFLLGSLTDKLIRSSPCPVITTKENIRSIEFNNIVLATDLESESRKLITLLSRMQSRFGATIHIVKVNTRRKFSNDIDSKVQLRRLADKYSLENFTVNCYSHEDEEYGIVYFSDDVKADLIAMGVHDRTGFLRLVSGGSLVSEVKNHTYRPVLTATLD